MWGGGRGGKNSSRYCPPLLSFVRLCASLSIRRFWGKEGREKWKGGGGERRVRNNSLSSPTPSPIRPLKSPLPRPLRPGSPDTQTTDAQTQQTFCFQMRVQVGAGEGHPYESDLCASRKISKRKNSKEPESRLVGLLQILFQHNRFLVLDTPKLPRIE